MLIALEAPSPARTEGTTIELAEDRNTNPSAADPLDPVGSSGIIWGPVTANPLLAYAMVTIPTVTPTFS